MDLRLLSPLLLALLLVQCSLPKVSSNAQPIEHHLWDTLLARHVSPEGWVDYKGFVRDSAQLNAYLALLADHHPNDAHWNASQRLAYWINAYNAYTVQLIVDHYPLNSIKDIKQGIPFVNTVWDIKFIEIEGEVYDLNNIEHGIIRDRFDEPRIHFAVNCASVSCPNLRPEAYTADQLEEQLDEQARAFLADPSKNRIEPQQLKLSKIFQWYRGDFTDGQSLLDFLATYAPVDIDPDADIDYLEYDWRLNVREHIANGEGKQ